MTRFGPGILGMACFLAGSCATPAPKSASCHVIHAQNVFDGKTMRRGDFHVHVVGKRVESVSPMRPVGSDDCRFTDLGQGTILPGLIDAHSHLLFTDRHFARDFSKELLEVGKLSPEARLELGESEARSLLHSGFTTTRDLGNAGHFLDEALHARLGRGPRFFYSGPGIAVDAAQFSPQTDPAVVRSEYDVWDSARLGEFLDERQRHGASWVKVYADNEPGTGFLAREEMARIVEAAHLRGIRVAAHASYFASASAAVSAGVDSIEHGNELGQETLQAMAQRGISLVATDFSHATCRILWSKIRDERFRDCTAYIKKQGSRLRRAQLAGVPLAFGSDAYVRLPGRRSTRGAATLDALYSYHEQGLSPLDTLRAATTGGARLLGRPDLGTLNEGATADLMGVHGNPSRKMRDLGRVAFVMKDGEIVCGPGNPCR